MAGPRIPLPKEKEQLRPRFLLHFDQYMRRAEEQVARAREMIEMAQQMCSHAAR